MSATRNPASAPAQVPTRVGIGLVARAGRYLIRQRPPAPGSPMPGYWEFPGGKCEGEEAPREAAMRECWEEAGLRVSFYNERRVIIHHYPHGLVELHYFDGTTDDPAAEPARGSGFIWVAAAELPGYKFPEANGPVVEALVAESLREHSLHAHSHNHTSEP